MAAAAATDEVSTTNDESVIENLVKVTVTAIPTLTHDATTLLKMLCVQRYGR